jgi:agmatine/peptidylarginine deiminase
LLIAWLLLLALASAHAQSSLRRVDDAERRGVESGPEAAFQGMMQVLPEAWKPAAEAPVRTSSPRGLLRGWRPARSSQAVYRLPGEFERQHAILVSCHEFVDDMPELLAELIAQLNGHLRVIALVNDVAEYQRAQEALARRGVPEHAIQFAEVPCDTMWCRDYGPILVEGPGGGVAAVDGEYVRGLRPRDDDVPISLCRQLRLPVVPAELCIEGGNLLSNGRGLCIATRQLLATNAEKSDASAVREALRRCFGAEQTVILEALSGEPTGHVDMFATFVSANTVVVGQYDASSDPVNAEILDRNAQCLAQVHTPEGPLRVVRLPMPRRDDQIWRTYTNVVYANGMLLVPTYPGVDAQGCKLALNAYRRLLPGWKIVALDTARLAELGGAVHCVTLNLGPLKQIPPLPRPRTILEEPDAIASAAPVDQPRQATRRAL